MGDVSMSWSNLEPWAPSWADRLDPAMPDHHNTRERLALRDWLTEWHDRHASPVRVLDFAVTGSRTWWDWRTMWAVLSAVPTNANMRNGLANGADNLALAYWRSATGRQPQGFEANWKDLGKRAGHERNRLMISPTADLVVGFLDHSGPSRGTRGALQWAVEIGLPTFVFHQKGL